MTRISIYSVDGNVKGNDKWIGSDAQNYNATKNFTPDKLADYFNHNQVIDSGNALRYTYQTLDPMEQRRFGTISFITEIGPQVNFSDISTFLLSKLTLKQNDVTQYLNFLKGAKVVISKASNTNLFGLFKITDVQVYLPEPNFFNVNLEFLDGNGFIKEDNDYIISLVLDKYDQPPTKTSDLTNDGSDGVNPFITLQDLPPSASTLQDVTNNGNTTTNKIGVKAIEFDYLTSSETPSIGKGLFQILNNSLNWILNGWSLKFSKNTNAVTNDINTIHPYNSGIMEIIRPLKNESSSRNIVKSDQAYVLRAISGISFSIPNGINSTDADYQFVSDTTSDVFITPDTSVLINGSNAPIKIPRYKIARLKYVSSNNWILSYSENIDLSPYLTIDSAASTYQPLLGYTPVSTSRTLSINGVSYDLSADRSWTITSMIYPGAGIPKSTGSGWDTSYGTTGIGTNVVLSDQPTLSRPLIDGGNPYIDFANGSTVTLSAGRMWYDGATGSWNLGMGGGNITQQVGEELFVYGKASAAITDSPLKIVYKTGTVGGSGVLTFGPTVAGITDGDLIIGVATESIANNGFGRVTCFGIIHGITTNGTAYGETWADGDVIWYNPVTGNPTNIKPVAPNIKVSVGTIIKAGNGGSGSFSVEINHGSVLGGTDSNVQLTSVANGNILTYDNSVGYWRNTALGVGGVLTSSIASNGVITLSATQATTSTDGYLSSTDWNTFNGKQNALGFTPENVANKQTDLTASSTKYPTVDAVNTGLATKGTKVVDFVGNEDNAVWDEWVNKNFGAILAVTGLSSLTNIRGNTSVLTSGLSGTFTYTNSVLLLTTTVAGNISFVRGAPFQQGAGTNSKMDFRFRPNVVSNDARWFAGVSDLFSTASPTNVELDTLINTFGVGKISTSNNLQIIHNDGSGLATLVDLGVNFPANDVNSLYDIQFIGRTSIYVRRLNTSTSTTFTYSYTMPNNIPTLGWNPAIYITNNGSAVANSLYFYSIIRKS